MLPPAVQIQEEFTEIASSLAQKSPTSPWTIADLRVNDMANFLGKAVPPDEFQLPADVGHAFVDGVCHWGHSNLDMENDIHKLAIFYGAIIYHALPDIALHVPKSMPHNPEAVLHILENLRWSVSSKGTSGRSEWFFMFVTAFIAYADPKSPLSREMNTQPSQLDNIKRWKHKICGYHAYILAYNSLTMGIRPQSHQTCLFHQDRISGCDPRGESGSAIWYPLAAAQ
jgi:hypothetical protein